MRENGKNEKNGDNAKPARPLSGSSHASHISHDSHPILPPRDLRMWDKDSKEAQYVCKLGRKTPQTYELYREIVETRPQEVAANIAICLINQANYLIDQQLRRIEKDFIEQGGLRERMTRVRLQYRTGNYGMNGKYKTNAPPEDPEKKRDTLPSDESR